MSSRLIRIGSRGSDLALTQSRYVAERLGSLPGDVQTEITIIQTRGDRVLDVPLHLVGESEASAGATASERKGVFTKELEDALLDGRIDLAVHSYKDLPSLMPAGLCIGAVPQRVAVEDVLVFPKERRVRTEAPFIAGGGRIGTSSVRRRALVEFRFPEVRCVELRGNVPTRIRKLFDEDHAERPDAILLARAGLDRLIAAGIFANDPGLSTMLEQLDIVSLKPEFFPPAPAQGALAVQCREDDQATRSILAQLHDAQAAAALTAERGLLAALEGGCHLPLGAGCEIINLSAQTSSNIALTEARMYVFLGRQAEDNRRGTSFHLHRAAHTPEDLARFVATEIQRTLPAVVTGKEDRIAEILARRPELPLTALPLLRTVDSFHEDPRAGKDLDNFLAGTPGRRVLALFSIAGARALRNLADETGHDFAGVEWGVVGERTAAAVRDFFGAEPHFFSDDGTGAGLAHVLSADDVGELGGVLAVAAERGREEFYEILFEAGVGTLKLSLYRTESIPPSEDALNALPREAYLLFGSPSAVQSFATAWTPDTNDTGWRYCALGPTTAEELRRLGKAVYACPDEPDYDGLIDALYGPPPA